MMRRSSKGSSSRLCRSPAAAARLPSPPPPPQRRRSSLAMSLPSLENLLSQAPPADLQNAAAPNYSATNNTSTSTSSTPSFRAALQARRSSLAVPMPLDGAMPPLQFWRDRIPRRASVLEGLPVDDDPLTEQSPTPFRRASTRAAASMVDTATVVEAVAEAPPMRRTSPRLREVGEKRSAEATVSSQVPNKRRKAPPPPRRRSHTRLRPPPTTTEACCICLSVPEANDVATIDGCAHCFCYGCIRTWSETENSCPLCKQRFTSIVHAGSDDPASNRSASVQRVPTRSQRSEAGMALDGLLANLTQYPDGSAGATSILNRLFQNGDPPPMGRFVLRSLGTPSGGMATASMFPPTGPSYAMPTSTTGMPMSLASLGGLALGGYSGIPLGGYADLGYPSLPPDHAFEPTLLNVIMRSSSTITTTTTTSVGLVPTASYALPGLDGPAAALMAYYPTPGVPVAASAAAAASPGFSLDTAIEIDSDEDRAVMRRY